jgi:phage terminase large subunit GpA-like protein
MTAHGRIHFPCAEDGAEVKGITRGYFESLCRERLVTKFVNGIEKRQWKNPSHASNEAWDCLVYGYDAFQDLRISPEAMLKLDRLHNADGSQEPEAPKPRWLTNVSRHQHPGRVL